MTDITATGVLTTAGKALLAQIIAGTSTDLPTKMQLGSGSTPAAASDTNLGTAHATTLLAATVSVVNTTTVQWYKQYTVTTTTVAREVGIKNTAGTLLCRAVLDADLSMGEGEIYNYYIQCPIQAGT